MKSFSFISFIWETQRKKDRMGGISLLNFLPFSSSNFYIAVLIIYEGLFNNFLCFLLKISTLHAACSGFSHDEDFFPSWCGNVHKNVNSRKSSAIKSFKENPLDDEKILLKLFCKLWEVFGGVENSVIEIIKK